MADSKRRKRKVKIGTETSVNVNNGQECEDNYEGCRSPALFVDNSQVKRKKSVKIRQKTNQKVKAKLPEAQNQHLSDTSIVSENEENAEDFVIEETKGQILSLEMIHYKGKSDQSQLNNHSNDYYCCRSAEKTNVDLSDHVQSGHDKTDACSSVEIPRDAMQSSALCLESLTQSPSFLLESSDKDSLIDSGRDRKCAFVTISSSRPSLSSCGSKVTNGCPSQMGSDYTYSYVSTYTDATGTVSTKTITASPPVKMKVCPNLNSTVCRGKDCIGDIEFPQSISPIVKQKAHVISQANCSQQECTFRSDTVGSLRMKDKMKKHTPRCSTVLLASEDTCSLPVISDSLSTIQSCDMGRGGENEISIIDRLPSRKHSTPQIPATREDNVTSRQQELKEFHKIKKRSFVKASTPRGLAKKLSFDISPVEQETRDHDELQIHNGAVADSDEVIVASLREPGSDDRLVTEHRVWSHQGQCGHTRDSVNDTSAACLLAHTGQKSSKMFIGSQSAGQDDECHSHSHSKHSPDTDNKAMYEKCFPQTVAAAFRSTSSVTVVTPDVLLVVTPDKQNIGSQCETFPDSESREIQAKTCTSHIKTPCTSLNGNTIKIDVHTKKCTVPNKQSLLSEQCSESHYQMTNMPSTHGKQNIQKTNSVPYEGGGTFLQGSLCHYATKKPYKKHSSKRIKQQSASAICYINRLCMASQECLHVKVYKAHQ